MNRSHALTVLALSLLAASAHADTLSYNFNATAVGNVQGGADGRAAGNGQWWLPDNAATAGDVRDGIGYGGTRGLAVGNRGNGNDGVIDNIHTAQLIDRAGETGFGTPDFQVFTSSYRFRTASETAVTGLAFKQESWGRDRTTWLSVYEDGGNLKANYSGVTTPDNSPNSDNFTDNIYSGTLTWGAWYRVETSIRFYDGADNDVVTTSIFDDSNALLWTVTDKTWENYYRLDSEQFFNGNLVTGVDAMQFQARGSPAGDVAFVDDITYSSSVPTPGALALLGIGGLASARRRRN